MIREAIAALVRGDNLSRADAAAAMEEIMTGEATAAQVAAFLTALRLKGETVDEIAGLAEVMREKATRVHHDLAVVDTCGTGGDGANTFNISTAAAFVVAGAGAIVAKHGNRAASSRCGSADVLEALGVNIALKPEQVAECLYEVGIGFMFAPLFHPSMKYAGPVRREIGIRTVFNILGPLTNPAFARRQVLGVPDPAIASKMAAALQLLGSQHALVVHSSDGLDELSLAAESYIYDVRGAEAGQVAPAPTRQTVQPEALNLAPAPVAALAGGDAEHNKEIILNVLVGKSGAQRDVVVLNAAAALVAADKAATLAEGVRLATESIDNGAARDRLHRLASLTQAFKS